MILSGYTHRCSAGETFDSVALMEYGDESHSSELLWANPNLCTVSMFSGGEVLNLPVVRVVESADNEAYYMPATAPWKE